MTKYLINGNDVSKNEFYRSLEEASDIVNDENDFNASLDDVNVVTILGQEYSASYVLKEVDPTRYRTKFADWQSDRYDGVMNTIDSRGIITLNGDLFEVSDSDYDGETDNYVEESLRNKTVSVFEWKSRYMKKNSKPLQEGNDLASTIKELEKEINSLGESFEDSDNTDVEGCEDEVCEGCSGKKDKYKATREARRKELKERFKASRKSKPLTESDNPKLDKEIRELSDMINSL